jgi:hypothetical protein
MLERLKRADEHAELLAGAQIFERMFLGDAHRANLFRSKRDQAITNRMRKRRETVALGADQRIGIELDGSKIPSRTRGCRQVANPARAFPRSASGQCDGPER